MPGMVRSQIETLIALGECARLVLDRVDGQGGLQWSEDDLLHAASFLIDFKLIGKHDDPLLDALEHLDRKAKWPR